MSDRKHDEERDVVALITALELYNDTDVRASIALEELCIGVEPKETMIDLEAMK